MGKRSTFERRPGDFYATPREAVLPLLPHLQGIRRFAEPCAGAGDLVRHLEAHGLKCVYAGDISDGRDALACAQLRRPGGHESTVVPRRAAPADRAFHASRTVRLVVVRCRLGAHETVDNSDSALLADSADRTREVDPGHPRRRQGQCRLVQVPARAHRRANSSPVPVQ